MGHCLTGWPLNYKKIQIIKNEKDTFLFSKIETTQLQEP